jgi:2-dehydro-3-deoxyphosphogluconate aldolase/(4S)-4-hydroxy-2-oxoglutarate aldolase
VSAETIAPVGRVIAILRGDYRESAEAVGEALVEGGLQALEVSLTSPEALSVVARLSRRLEGRALVGVGTLRRPEDCRRAADAGARFAMSPHTSPELIGAARAAGLAAIPGAFTPTEISAALDAGADVVKLFPADWVGGRGLTSLLAPFPGVRFVPTGGVGLDAAREYLARGAWAVGVGSPLMGAYGSGPSSLRALAERARAFAQVAAKAPPFSSPGPGAEA